MGPVHSGATKCKMLKRECSAFCVADNIIVVTICVLALRDSVGASLGNRGRGDLAGLLEEVFEVGRDDRSRLDEGCFECVNTVGDLCEVLCRGIVGRRYELLLCLIVSPWLTPLLTVPTS